MSPNRRRPPDSQRDAGKPIYLLASRRESIEASLAELEVRRKSDDSYVVMNAGQVAGIPETVAVGRTRTEAISRARRAITARRMAEVRRQEYIRSELLGGLPFRETSQGWRLMHHDFLALLRRAARTGARIHMIEAWRENDFVGFREPEDYGTDPTDSRWPVSAFREIAGREKGLEYYAVVEVPAGTSGDHRRLTVNGAPKQSRDLSKHRGGTTAGRSRSTRGTAAKRRSSTPGTRRDPGSAA